MYLPRLALYYRPEMAPESVSSFSKSPTKPRRFVDFLRRTSVWGHVDVVGGFPAVTRDQLLTAHTPAYVDTFVNGSDDWLLCESNGIGWSAALRDSVLATNGSILAAVQGAYARPEMIAMSPASGFHHATPEGGQGFCTFSGQVIAALEMYRTHGAVGAWIDLDGHYGNSIEDSRSFAPDLNKAIPPGCNLNPSGTHRRYLDDLERQLLSLGDDVVSGRVHYVCFAHGADSHEWDDLGGQVTTDEWIEASRMVYQAIHHWSLVLGRPVPVVIALFGGYRDDHPQSVLSLHAMDTAIALEMLAGVTNDFAPHVQQPRRGR